MTKQRDPKPEAFDPEFFPTPRRIIDRMLARIDTDAKYYLEPSAGRGDIARAILKRHANHWGSNNAVVECIEASPDLCAILTNRELTVIGVDFLTYDGVSYYDAIVMNPPFSNGTTHLLRAWDFLHAGEGDEQSSDLIISAVALTRARWDPPEQGIVTFVDPAHVPPTIRRGKPIYGYCYLKAGWSHVGYTKAGLWAWQQLPAQMPAADYGLRGSLLHHI
jgi:hypothetical protein